MTEFRTQCDACAFSDIIQVIVGILLPTSVKTQSTKWSRGQQLWSRLTSPIPRKPRVAHYTVRTLIGSRARGASGIYTSRVRHIVVVVSQLAVGPPGGAAPALLCCGPWHTATHPASSLNYRRAPGGRVGGRTAVRTRRMSVTARRQLGPGRWLFIPRRCLFCTVCPPPILHRAHVISSDSNSP